MYIKGITDYSKACVLIALKDLFTAEPYYGQIDWGEDFLVDYFLECGSNGFNSTDNYLIEESAPVTRLQQGSFTSTYNQGDVYWQIIHWDTMIRYRLPRKRNVILIYHIDDTNAHAVCITADRVNEYLNKYKFGAIILPNYGLIIDRA